MKPAKLSGLSIAIDGPAGAGKSTTAKMLARELRIVYVDSGAMYRAVAWKCNEDAIPLNDPERIAAEAAQISIEFIPSRSENEPQRIVADGIDITNEIRTPEMSRLASTVSVIPAVREALVAKQRALGQAGAVVMEGRDIGTVVLPDADVKIFLTASIDNRAQRRTLELRQKGDATATLDSVRAEIAERDRRDMTRAVSPLRAADDAVTLNNDSMTAREVVEFILDLCAKKTAQQDIER
ncbi:MAG: (d)CMP kinase [Capsulimonadaceae bacterium]|nr:(d)CMP kinase [Capsulimonadaceae bacterium]